MGVLENVEVLGKSGADLETELLHHQTSPRAPGGETATDQLGGETTSEVPESTGAETFQQKGGSNDLERSPGARAIAPPEASPPADPESPPPDPDASLEEAIDADAQPPPES